MTMQGAEAGTLSDAPARSPEGGSRRRTRLMLFTDSFTSGGTERQFVETLRLLNRDRYDVIVGCIKRRGPFLADVEALGVPILEFPIRSLYGPNTMRQFFRLAGLLRRERIDIVHTFDFYTGLFAVPAARWAGVPVAIASRRDLLTLRSAPRRWAIQAGCLLANGIVANSAAATEGLLFGSERKTTLIPNVLDTAVFRAARPAAEVRAALGIPLGAPAFGAVAAMRPEKGLDVLLRAAAVVFRSLPQSRVVLVGDGSEREHLMALATELGISDHVVFAGDRKDVPDVLAALDVSVLPSHTESLPNAVLEAMALGKPVVSTKVGGTPDLVDEGRTGYLVPPANPEEMARGIVALLQDHGLRESMGRAGLVRVQQKHSPDHVRQRLESMYDRLLRTQRPLARVLQISNYPPPMDGWAIHVVNVQRAMAERGVDSRVLDIGPGRRIEGRDCDTVQGSLDYVRKLFRYRRRGFVFQPHVNGDSWKGYVLALMAVLVGRLTGKPAVLMFHAGPSQIYFPRSSGRWYHLFKFLFRSSGQIICNFEPVKQAIMTYGVPPEKVHPIFSVGYKDESSPVPLPPAVEAFLKGHEPRLFSYTLFRPEFTTEALFEAFARIRREYPRAGLLVAGPRETPPEIVQQLRERGIESDVMVPGNLPHPEFLTAVQRCDVFIRTHLRDGVCASVLEALGLGVPVVAAEDGLRPPSVITFLPGDGADLAIKVRDVLADLPAARARVVRPELGRGMNDEIDLLIAAAAR